MWFSPLVVAIVSVLTFVCSFAAEERLADLLADPTTRLSNPPDRARLVARLGQIENTRRQNSRAHAVRLGLPLRTLQPNGRIQEIVDFDGERPLYFTTGNLNAAISSGANLLQTSPYALTGSGVTIGLWDGGSARSTHQEFDSRVTVMDGAPSIDHATHVGGTLIASGLVAAAHGMAASATLNSYDWTNDSSEMASRGATYAGEPGKIYLSNHSYGIVSGWNYVNSGSPNRLWEWYGSGTTASSTESDFGRYNASARDSDALAFNAPYYLIFRSAGNERADNPAAGDPVALSPGSSSVVSYNPTTHPAGDGNYRGGFETIGYEALAKNGITIGSAADAVTNGIRDPSKATLSYFSSCGPTDDGRIKPDLVANGEALYSSLNASDTSYGSYSGTSMATPNAVGSSALLIQQYSNIFPGQAMQSSTLKGLLIHTADDCGTPGPDYQYGWGLINVQAAADLIRDHDGFPSKQRISENQLSSAIVSRTQSFVWDGISAVCATLCWTDPAATAITTADSRSSRLVNNLNLKIIAPNGTEFFPYVMPFVGTWTQAAMSSPATTGINNTDNVEQVRIVAPPVAGSYQVVVSFSGSLVNNSQNYSLLLSGSAGEPVTVPSAPTNLVATPANNRVSLTWSAASTANRYQLKRSISPGGPYTTLVISSALSETDTTAFNDTRYYYVVSASNGSGESANSEEVSARPFALPSTLSIASSSGASGMYDTVVNLTASVGGGTASGTATFYDAATLLGSAAVNASGQATLSTRTFTIGNHSLTATYSGDTTLGPSLSNTWVYTVTPKALSITGVSAAPKIYDATTTATLSGGTLVGVVSGETVTLIPGLARFESADVGTRIVTASNYTLSGPQAGNYELSAQPTVASARITPRPLRLTGSRPYDATTNATAANLTIQNNLDGPLLTLSGEVKLAGMNLGLQTILSTQPASRVQVATANTGTSTSTSFKLTLPSTPIPGNTLVAVIATRSTSPNRVAAITQAGAVWTRATQATNSSGTTTEIWFTSNLSAAASSLTINQALLRSAAVVIEYAGLLSSDPLDQVNNSTGSSTAPVSGTTAMTRQANELWIAAIGFANSTPTLGSFLNSFSSVASAQSTRSTASSNAKVYALERSVNPADTAFSGGSLSTSGTWSGAIASFITAMPGTLTLGGPAAANYTLIGASGSLLITPTNDWLSWCNAHFTAAEQTAGLAAENADPDFDHWPNLAEYALGSDPRQFTPPRIPTLDADGLSITFSRPANLPDVLYGAESSTDLSTWSQLTLEMLVPGSIETLRARQPFDNRTSSQRFLRLRFTRP